MSLKFSVLQQPYHVKQLRVHPSNHLIDSLLKFHLASASDRTPVKCSLPLAWFFGRAISHAWLLLCIPVRSLSHVGTTPKFRSLWATSRHHSCRSGSLILPVTLANGDEPLCLISSCWCACVKGYIYVVDGTKLIHTRSLKMGVGLRTSIDFTVKTILAFTYPRCCSINAEVVSRP